MFMKRYLKLCFCVAYLLAGFCQNVFGQQPLDAAYMSGSEVTCVPETQMQMDTVNQFSDFHCEELDLYAKSAVLTDADTGRILYGKEANSPMANASTTKIMTCLLAIESGKTGDSVTFSEYACSMPKVRLGCSVGTQFLLEDLLYSLMLESHNDTAVAIAEYVAGSVQHFAVQMNERAAELGCLDTHFVTPNGLDKSDEGGAHQTTAYDLSRIMAACIQNDKFLKITQTVSKTISSMDGTFRATLHNHNALLSMVEGVISGKTGFTAKAGYCYVGAYRKEDRTYTFALLACGWPNNKGYKWEDARKLIAYGNEHYVRQLYSADGEKRQIPIRNGVKIEEEDTGRKKYTYTYPEHFAVETETVRQELLLSDADVITETWNLPKTVEAPVKAGNVIGEHRILLNGCQIVIQPVYVVETVEKFTYRWCLKHIFFLLFLGKI